MVNIKIKIQSLADAQAGMGLVDAPAESITELTDITVGVLEQGTVSGATSVMILLKDADGKYVMAQTTAQLFIAAAKAVEGAVERFGK